MIIQCTRCFIKYNNETINHCPICKFSFKDIKGDIQSKEIKYMLSVVQELKVMVNSSTKGQPKKSSGGFRLIDPFIGHQSLKRT